MVASDSDPKYNTSMRQLSMLGCETTDFINKDYFACGDKFNFENDTFYFQDLIHIVTKLRNSFLKSINNKKVIPFGSKYFVQLEHLYVLLDNFLIP